MKGKIKLKTGFYTDKTGKKTIHYDSKSKKKVDEDDPKNPEPKIEIDEKYYLGKQIYNVGE